MALARLMAVNGWLAGRLVLAGAAGGAVGGQRRAAYPVAVAVGGGVAWRFVGCRSGLRLVKRRLAWVR